MIPTVEEVVQGLLIQGYRSLGGSDVFRILVNKKTGRRIKIYYDSYDNPNHIIIRESLLGYND